MFTRPEHRHAVCRCCGYALLGVAAPVCPECGRGFDPADPATFDVSGRARSLRRWGRRALTAGLLAGVVYAIGPRGYAVVSMTLTDVRSGIDSEVRHVRPVGPPWLPLLYPGWSIVRDRGATRLADGPPPGGGSLAFTCHARKRLVRRGWLRPVDSFRASGSGPPGLVITMNSMAVGATTAVAVARSTTREMARLDCCGVSLNEFTLPGESDLISPP